jgi:hypothetical protein
MIGLRGWRKRSRAGWIDEGQTISREARVEQVRQAAERRSLMRDKTALLRIAGE